ncbi:lysine--tRNA ligase [Candidatus Parcubacteria bacterium]|nr:lysine--tRNA ligase [Candidatus Parcubacteria bacterium]
MAQIDNLKQVRIEKLKKIKEMGLNPFPAKTKRTHTIKEALEGFAMLSKKETEVWLAGRIMIQRGHGAILFLSLKDGTGDIQVILKKDVLGEKALTLFEEVMDVGDFIEVKGVLTESKTKEKSLLASDFNILTKTLLPMPEKFHGLQDEEECLRKRYLDILFNPEIKEMVIKRDLFWNSIRNFLKQRGFLEVETPVLETKTGGADARPFITHHNALDLDVYLRISMGELWQKKLMAAGFEKTFEVGRQFRNEGMSPEHSQDYTQMEFYWAYADYEEGMKLVEELYKHIAKATFGTLKFKIRGFEIDLGKKWERYDYQEIIKKKTGVDILKASLEEIEKTLKKLKIDYDKKGFNTARAIDSLWKYCRKNIAGPGFLINLPVVVSPLAKRLEKNPELTQRFQVILAGSELGNGYSELNNPLDQAERFKEQQKLREAVDEEAQMYDHDFVEMLEYGMPPTCGFGLSERLFSFLMDKPARECQIFPLMKPKQ